MNTVKNANLTEETMDRLKKAIRLRKSNRIMQHQVAAEMGYASKSTVGNIERVENNYGPETIERYIRTVYRLARMKRGKPCASPQISITIPAPAEPTPDPVAAPAEPSIAGASIAELLAIRDRCNEGLARHRVAWATMMGRDDAATWEAMIAAESARRSR